MASTMNTKNFTMLRIEILQYKDSMSITQYSSQSNTYTSTWLETGSSPFQNKSPFEGYDLFK